MWPKKRTVTIEVWDCGKGHRHQTEAIASKCMLKPVTGDIKRKSAERALEVLALHRSGLKTKQIADKYDVTVSRVQQIIKKGLRVERAQSEVDGDL